MFSLFSHKKAPPDENTPLSGLKLPIRISQSGERVLIRNDEVCLRDRSFGIDSNQHTIRDIRHMIDSLLAAEQAGWGTKKMDS